MATDEVRRKAQKAAAARWAKAADRTNDDDDDQQTSPIKMLTKRKLIAELDISEWTLADWIRKGKFPKPVALNPGHPAKWRLIDVKIWLERRIKKPMKAPLRGALRRRVENK